MACGSSMEWGEMMGKLELELPSYGARGESFYGESGGFFFFTRRGFPP